MYVLACVSGSAHAGVRGHGEKGGSGRGGWVSWGYVAGLVGSRDLLRRPRPGPSAEFVLRAEAVSKPAALPRRKARSLVRGSVPAEPR